MSNQALWDKTLQKTNLWLKELAGELGWVDMEDTLLAFRTVTHALRDRLPPGEASHLAAQFPLLLKGVYFDGWAPRERPVKARARDEFLALIRPTLERGTTNADVEQVTRAVFRVLASRISAGEIADIRGILPQELAELWPERATASRAR